MATYTTTFFSGNATIVEQTSSMIMIQNAFKTAGWVRTADTGQASPGGTAVNVTAATGNGTNATYTYNATTQTGPPLQVGMTITTVSCTTAGFNATKAITALGGSGASSTFTTANTTSATESETAFGVVDTVLLISSAVGNGTTVTFTYDDTQVTRGGQILAGMSIVVTGTTHFNATYTILTAPPVGYGTTSATFTAASSTNASDTGLTAAGTVTAQTTAAVSTLYDIWQTTDALTTYYVKLTYNYTNTNATFAPIVQQGNGTNGSGTLLGANTATTINNGSTSAGTVGSIFASGTTGNFRFAYAVANTGYFAVERSCTNAGVYNSSYVTMLTGTNNTSVFTQQSNFLSPASATTQESSGWIAALPRAATTGNFNAGTMVSPVFPAVGIIGNPLQGTLVFRGTDFTGATQVSVTVYSSTNNYYVLGWNNTGLWNAGQACGNLMLYQ